ncbi:MAG: hypothetical protein P8N09_02415 [Planctomycetota bacterium]|nr:hypothetical protein [Planctomycetota bacterium]
MTRTNRRLDPASLARNTASTSFASLGFEGLQDVCRLSSNRHPPARTMAREERDGFPIVYSETRAQRLDIPDDVCVVCEEQTCPVVDQIHLPGDDVAWFTPNLYPITYPHEEAGAESRGIHLVHWSSLRHDKGLGGSDRATATALLQHLARAEEFLLHHAPSDFPDRGEGHRGHVGIVKNRGHLVGGSVQHDHQQVMLSAAVPSEPPRIAGLAHRLLDETPEELIIDCTDGAATTLVPSFMRRPLQTFIVPHGDETGWLHHMEPSALEALAVALAQLTAITDTVMTERWGEPAWNLILHTGPGTGPLIEMRPFTQPLGGFEHLGLYLCEELPATSAGRLREALG